MRNSPEGMKTCLMLFTQMWPCVYLPLCHQLLIVQLNTNECVFVVCMQDVYSKRIIPTACITGLVNVGDQKFEVVTYNRTFLFRAESDGECVCV